MAPHKPDAGFGDFSVDEAADTISLTGSDGTGGSRGGTPIAARRRKQLIVRLYTIT